MKILITIILVHGLLFFPIYASVSTGTGSKADCSQCNCCCTCNESDNADTRSLDENPQCCCSLDLPDEPHEIPVDLEINTNTIKLNAVHNSLKSEDVSDLIDEKQVDIKRTSFHFNEPLYILNSTFLI